MPTVLSDVRFQGYPKYAANSHLKQNLGESEARDRAGVRKPADASNLDDATTPFIESVDAESEGTALRPEPKPLQGARFHA
jgi:hypothetical protein